MILVKFCSNVRSTAKTVTVSGTGTSFIFHERMIPKLEPPPPLTAQKRSSPIELLSRILPCTLMNCASMTLSAARPYFLIIAPYPPPLTCPPSPKAYQTPPGNPRFWVFCAIP
ncbi:hypothetical protein HanXRQr2_Chr03g0136751 [Helianthus annuus]|uniref:Uncharacterized protein n=1 Tax=Helianthus annuus TaxID=4232 RepID=A0A9K3NXZ9_HELAN|nr:hypothetical protein HanXRQr2_Chr03g0136751 [Helianthus annuus]KAJ0603229.1 hypothetical protein HanIR_Chr03g0148211 [Helianthus annuus]KAJ0945907.1 hypothetical protein HanPSC8_Chr03g0133311 [Helianthus annuus]